MDGSPSQSDVDGPSGTVAKVVHQTTDTGPKLAHGIPHTRPMGGRIKGPHVCDIHRTLQPFFNGIGKGEIAKLQRIVQMLDGVSPDGEGSRDIIASSFVEIDSPSCVDPTGGGVVMPPSSNATFRVFDPRFSDCIFNVWTHLLRR